MSISEVTRRFLICLDKLVDERVVRSKRQFALSLGYHPQGISEMMAERRDAPLDLIEKAVSTYRFSPVFLFGGTGPCLISTVEDDNLRLRHLTVITDQKGDERIVHVPCPAQAGYGKWLDDPVFMQELPSFQLPDPQFRSGTYRSFEVSGSSMEPTFCPNDIVIAAYIEPRYWEQALKNNQIFIIITRQEVIIKRIINRIKPDKVIQCISDNSEFDHYTMPIQDVLEIWKVRMKLTSHLEPHQPALNTNTISEQLMVQQQMLENLQRHLSKSSIA